jgi:hypothetical protein
MSDDYIHPLSINGQLMKKDARIAELEALLKDTLDYAEGIEIRLDSHDLAMCENKEVKSAARAALNGENSDR